MSRITLVTRKILYILFILLLNAVVLNAKFGYGQSNNRDEDKMKSHMAIVKAYYAKRANWTTSNLGSILFKQINPATFDKKKHKTYKIAVWKCWRDLIESRNFNFYPKKSKNVLSLAGCRVKNCEFFHTENAVEIYKADAVLMTLYVDSIIELKQRNYNQRWILLSDESPMELPNNYIKPYYPLKDLANLFNWTMTYRSDADIPIPFGRTLPLPFPKEVFLYDPEGALTELVPFYNEKQTVVLANILLSNCFIKKRMQFLAEIQKYIRVDINGACAPDGVIRCPGYIRNDCKVTREYLFYLVLESASCRQYISEKCFLHAYNKGAIPVIMGPPKVDCEKLLPPHSFIHVDSFNSIAEMAQHIVEVSRNRDLLLSYHKWRIHFTIANEHGYFGTVSPLFCRVCEALNYNDEEEKVYKEDDLDLYFDKKLTCDVHYSKHINQPIQNFLTRGVPGVF